ncbi:MAG TPA: hypothetical protein VFH47_00730, partial [Candidatus Thermoplasmatota archaeon]|nr:hypothetical protein [Candidatus Thermoplasmatota archaeon]
MPERSPYYRPPPEAPQGRPRSMLAYMLLSVVTLLTYPFVYYWKVFAELDRQNRRRSPLSWYIAWVVFWVVLLIGAAVEVALWLFDRPAADLAVHIALFATAGALFFLCGAMHVTLG